MTRKSGLFLAAIVLATTSAASTAQAGYSAIAQLSLNGQPGNYILNGTSANVTYTDFLYGSNSAQTNQADGGSTNITFVLDQVGAPANTFAILEFSTQQLGVALAPGTYLNAQRAPFEDPGHAGLSVSFQNRGYNNSTGSFTINYLTFFNDPTNSGAFSIASFSASFTEIGDADTGSISGTLTYLNYASVVPEPASLAMVGMGLLGLAGWVRLRRRHAA